ncbi:DUF3253 domain-containing protein [Roseovarius aestuariivivens]|uniref:DUF3253 domain-containing protein n=1 Tax=Roseovarius aestuariivivens TaxID=1888910 RepID=UPI0024780200|nr:DUF3253 domain-containing protein [Roseovarius aestuariivivens]
MPALPEEVTQEAIEEKLMELARSRGPGKTFCPSEAARALARDWRPLMPYVREIAARLPMRATQRGKEVDPLSAKGPIRLSLR